MTETGTPATFIVGIGASAGGLTAFKAFLANTPSDTGMAFIFVQHLDPEHSSLLVELLAPHSTMPVVSAEDGAVVAANHVYVIPPNATLTISNGILQVVTPAPAREQRRPIDALFLSLAQDQGERAASIVLAGLGSDGTQGLRAIKARGGLTLAQAEFNETALPGMPKSAAATGLVDHVVPVEIMPAKLIEHLRELSADTGWKQAHGSPTDWPKNLARVATLLRAAVGHDFSDYKQNTRIRRVQRRMLALGIDNIEGYIAVLESEPHEADLLFRELLIGVTQFFRDPAAFAALEATVIPGLLTNRDMEDVIRVWVPGCATGEEVYSLAILLKEAIDAANSDLRVTIFGTDINATAIAFARAGRYRKTMTGLAPERLARWFIADGDFYTPVTAIRDMCVFSVHSLVKDPPFSKLDLISCRNVLIYLNSELQHRVRQTFHYALKPGGHLFLGPSENATRDANMFNVVDRTHRILERLVDSRATLPRLGDADTATFALPEPKRVGIGEDRVERSVQRAMERHSPVYFVVDRQCEIVRFSGPDAGRYVEPSPGAASLNLFSLLRKSLRSAVRMAVHTAMNQHREVIEPDVDVNNNSNPADRTTVTLIVEPIEEDLYVVAFRDADAVLPRATTETQVDAAGGTSNLIEQELRVTKSQLKATNNELETYIEEQKSATEEMQSINEELQCSNEELETAKEEMQSVNEELQTVNSELQAKNEALERFNDDLQNLLDSTQIATLFLDKNLRIRNFTPAMTEIFHLRDGDRGRPITEIASRLDYTGLERDVETVQRTLSVVEQDMRLKANGATAFLMRVRPYRTLDDRIDGVVVTLVDVSAMKRAETARHDAEMSFRLAQEAAGIGTWQWDLKTNAMHFSPHGIKLIGYEPADGPLNYEWFFGLVHPDDIAALELDLRKCREGSGDWQREFRILSRDGVRWLLGRGHLLLGDERDAAPAQMRGIHLDITERKWAEERQKTLTRELDHRVKNVLALVVAVAQRTHQDATTMDAFLEAFTARIESMARTHSQLSRGGWRGVDLAHLVRDEIAPYANPTNTLVEGPALVLSPAATQVVALAVHELATNAAKYGALSASQGRVSVRWVREAVGTPEARLVFEWRESGGPAVVLPVRRGYGSGVIRDLVLYELRGSTVDLDFAPGGVACRIEVPQALIEPHPG